MLLHSKLKGMNVVCFSQDWLKEEYIKLISITNKIQYTFWGTDNESILILQLQKKVIWITCSVGTGTS
jgi:hypothetical protein